MRTLSDRIITHTVGLLMYALAILATYHLMPVAYVLYDMSSGGSCGYSQPKEYPSPDGSKKIVVSLFDCGATTGFSTHVSLHDGVELTAHEGPIYGNSDVGEHIHDQTVQIYGRQVPLTVVWKDSQFVNIIFPPQDGEALKQVAEQMNGVTVRAIPNN